MTVPFDIPANRRSSDSIKWNLHPEEVLPLWVADTDFQTPPQIISAIKDRLDHGIFGYSFPQEKTINTICSWLERRHAWSVSPEEVLLFPGVVPAFNIAARMATNPGDSVLIQTPAYHPFLDLPANVGLTLSEHTLQPDQSGRYFIDLEAFEKSIRPQTRIFMLCNPQNPTGRVFERSELEAIARICLDHNLLICSDEIHSDLVYASHQHIPIASLSEEIALSTITLISPSKTFNLAGLKSSAVIIKDAKMRERFIRYTRGQAATVNVLGEAALTAAYSLCDDWLGELLEYLASNREYLFNFVSQEMPGVTMSKPEGTFLGWLDFTNTEVESPADHILHQGRVALNAGTWFGSGFPKFARINFGCPATILEQALERIRSALISP